MTYNETTVLNEDCENNKQKIATDNDITLLDEIRTKNINRLIIGNLNINSLSSKFEQLKVSIQGKIDILIITETKLDDSFSVDQFAMNGYTKPYRFDRNRNGGGVTIYIREDIPSRELNLLNIPSDIESIFIEISLF